MQFAPAELSIDHAGVLVLSGDLVITSANQLARKGKQLIQDADADILIDLSQVQTVSTVAVALLLEWIRTAKACNLNIKIQAVPQKLLSIITFSDLDELFAEHIIAA